VGPLHNTALEISANKTWDTALKKLIDRIGIELYRLILVFIFIIPAFFDIRIFYALLMYFCACLPGILNDLLNKPDDAGDRMFFVSGRILFPYEVFVFVWNGFRLKS
jgi:hypothetical protein